MADAGTQRKYEVLYVRGMLIKREPVRYRYCSYQSRDLPNLRDLLTPTTAALLPWITVSSDMFGSVLLSFNKLKLSHRPVGR